MTELNFRTPPPRRDESNEKTDRIHYLEKVWRTQINQNLELHAHWCLIDGLDLNASVTDILTVMRQLVSAEVQYGVQES